MEVIAPRHSQEDVATRNPPTLKTGSRFPLELVDNVMKEMHNSRMSLSNCLLVCRDWARLAYPYHFENFCYSPQGWDNSIYIHGTLSPFMLEPRDLVNFFIFLRNSPIVCGCIRQLRLNGRITQEHRYVLDLIVFGAILQMLPNLRILSLRVRLMECSSAAIGTRLKPSPVCLDQLHFTHELSSDTDQMLSLLSLFTSIRSVSFHGSEIYNEEDEDSHVPALQDKFPIESLCMYPAAYWSFQEWVKSFIPLVHAHSVKSLVILGPQHDEAEHPEVMQTLIRTLGCNLEELKYGWICCLNTTPLDLSPCVNLHSLDIFMRTPVVGLTGAGWQGFMSASWPAAAYTLINAPFSVRSMSLKFVVGDDSDTQQPLDVDHGGPQVYLSRLCDAMGELDWSLLDMTMDTHPALEEFTIRVDAAGLIESEESAASFESSMKAMLVQRCFGTPTRKKLLDLAIHYYPTAQTVHGGG